jgi:restriction endonuclease S subunit
MLQDIKDGEIAQDLPNISGIERSQLKYCVHDGDVVLSKIVSGANFKVAIAHVAPGEKLLATGNLYIIRPDKSKLLPEYLKLCLESEPCRQQLLREGVGSAALSVPIKALQVLKIPNANMEKQHEIAKRYKALQKQVASHKRAIATANEKLAALLTAEGVI